MSKKVKGSKDGLVCSNSITKRVGPIVNVSDLKNRYLTGLDITDPTTGEKLPDSAYQSYIDNAIAMLETYLDIAISPTTITEIRDYRFNDYFDWGYIKLNNFPVISIDKMEMTWFRDGAGNAMAMQEIPPEWIRLQPHDGIIRLIPNSRFPASLQVGSAGGFFPEIMQSQFVPHLWEITYTYGFCDGAVPTLINHAIAQIASLQALIVGGNLVVGAGIASTSLSIDGLSQSISTTSSAENSSYSATIKEYMSNLYGANPKDPFGILTILKNYYKGSNISII